MQRSSNIAAILTLVLLASFTEASLRWGGCPTINYQDNFDISKYLGTWYLAARPDNVPFATSNCVRAQYGNQD